MTRRLVIRKLTAMARIALVAALLGGCLASGGTATVMTNPTPTTMSATATATATAIMVPTPTPGMPTDFAFRFDQDFCGDAIQLDTFAGIYYAQIRDGAESARVSLVLTPTELLAYYREIVAFDPFNLPDEITPAAGQWPRIEYGLYVRMNGRTESLYWSGHTQGGTPTIADLALQRFAAAMSTLVWTRPELRELRNHGVNCT